ncbi:MAG TPA: DNA polymerase III subunit gamma/tau [Candidatus Paceibacterota bacterium]
MAYQSLYRAYRPQSFKEVAGQEQVTRPLAEALKSGKAGHAYLFAGSRGLGKTTVARILAKELGCTERDLYEVDAASNNSVEDIRALTEGVYTLPFESPYKVYILDEVHMLSKAAWNAFLKTLEEPPAHAIFILATTELDRVPETVQSRCQVFEFKKPTRHGLAEHAKVVAKKEGYALEPDAAELIARLAGGSYRDALSVLQKVISSIDDSYPGGPLTRNEVERTTGAPKREQVHALVTALASGERAAALTAVEHAASASVDMTLYLELVLETLRSALLVQYAPDLHAALKAEHDEEEFEMLEALPKSPGITHQTLLAFLTASERIHYAPIAVLPLELAVLELFPDEQ